MRSSWRYLWGAGSLVLLILSLTACQPGAIRSVDDTDEPRQSNEESVADIYVKLAVAYIQEGKLDMALKKVRRGLEVDPDYALANNVIALIYERLNEVDLAEKYYRKAAALDPKDPYIHNAFGSFLCGQGRFEEAEKEFSEALRNPLYSTPEVALLNAGICANRKGDKSAAEGYFRRSLQANPTVPQALLSMMRISFDKGNYLSVRGYLQRYLEVAGHTAETLWLGIQTERRLGDLDAVASYELLLRSDFPDSEEVRQLMESEKP